MRLLFAALFAFALAGCATTARDEAPPGLASTAAPLGFPSSVRMLSFDRRSAWTSSAELLRGLRAAATDGHVDILALSGGGAGGAFGAGALVGLTERGERPQFELVTGVSSGALIAPFAFLGPKWDAELSDAAMTVGKASLLQWRGGIVFDPAVYSGEPLSRFVNRIVTPQLVEAVAQESRKGRVLLVATTDLDKEETVIWNLGAIAEQGGEEARRLLKNVLLASASIPGLFPPVMIRVQDGNAVYDEMHVDGGATQSFFIAPQINHYFGGKIDGLAGANVYVIVNGQMGVAPHTTPLQSLPILSRSFSATMKHISRTDIGLASDFAQKNGMNFRFSVIPTDYPFLGPLSFDSPAIEPLFAYAKRCAAAGKLWISIDRAYPLLSETSPPAADPASAKCPADR